MKYFFDNCISPKIVEILRLAGAEDEGDELVHIKDVSELDRNDLDIKWMPLVAQKGWTAITVDHQIKRKPHERIVLAETKLRIVFLPKGFHDLGRWDQVCFILKHWRNMAKRTHRCVAGDRFMVTMHGKVERF